MSDDKNPLPTVAGKRTEGTLLDEPSPRVKRKSPFLLKLERQKRNAELGRFVGRLDNVTEIKPRGK